MSACFDIVYSDISDDEHSASSFSSEFDTRGISEGDILSPSLIPSRSKPTQDIVTYLVKMRKNSGELKFCS